MSRKKVVCSSAQRAISVFTCAFTLRHESDGSRPCGSRPRISTRVPEERRWISRTISATPSATSSGWDFSPGVVGADQQHHQPGPQRAPLVRQPLQHALRVVAADAEQQRRAAAVELAEQPRIPARSEGVADEHQPPALALQRRQPAVQFGHLLAPSWVGQFGRGSLRPASGCAEGSPGSRRPARAAEPQRASEEQRVENGAHRPSSAAGRWCRARRRPSAFPPGWIIQTL